MHDVNRLGKSEGFATFIAAHELNDTYDEFVKSFEGEINGLYKQLNEANEKLERSVVWSVDDFAYVAKESGKPEDYDPDCYDDALRAMIQKYDATIGITWETIKVYLDNYCRKEKKADVGDS